MPTGTGLPSYYAGLFQAYPAGPKIIALYAADDILLSLGWRLKILYVLFFGYFLGCGLLVQIIRAVHVHLSLGRHLDPLRPAWRRRIRRGCAAVSALIAMLRVETQASTGIPLPT